MPSRGFYHVTDKEGGQAAEHDESYKSCVITLLIFFFLCIILILAGLPWRKYDTYHIKYPDDNFESAQRHHHDSEHYTKKTTTTTESVKHYSNNDIFVNKPVIPETTASEFEHSESTRNFDVTDATISISSSSEFEKLPNVETSTEQEISTFLVINEEFVTDKQLYQDSSTTDRNSLIENINATETNASSVTVETSTLSLATETNTSSLAIETSTSNLAIETNTSNSAIETSTSSFVTEEYSVGIMNDSFSDSEIYTTQQISTSTDLNFIRETISSDIYENTTGSVIESTTESEENSTIKTTTNYLSNTITDSITETMPSITTGRPIVTTPEYEHNKRVCTTGECKNIASKMLFYMNHTVDPCDDFYEYACGGFEANPQTIEVNLENAAHQRILRQSQKSHDGTASLFTKYYNSCMQYENIDFSERIKLAKEVLDKIGKFYTTDSWVKNHANFTELVAKLLLHNSALLFDVTPDLEEYTPNQLTLKIGPTTYECPFDTEETEDPCYAKQYKKDQEAVDLGKLYKEYKTCKNNTKKFIKSITEALTALGVFHELGNAYNITQYLETLVINIDFEIVQTFFANYPSKDQIREAYLMKNYTRVTIATLQEKANVINWTELIYALTKETILPDAHVQVYFYNVLIEGLRNLKEFEARDPMQLNNILLGLYAHNLYQKLVLSKHRHSKEHCLRIAANMLFPEASSLYISSFSNDELLYMNKTIHSLFKKLKETLKLKIEEAEWTEEIRKALVAKIHDLKVTVPDITDSSSIYRKTRAKQLHLSDNYFKNSVTLMRKYRELIYSEFFTDLGHSEQIWTHYATPFQSKGLAIYGLNLVVIPFGVIDWSTKYDESLFDYIILATLGNAIAHQIAHHFDANGIYYWNGTRDTEYFPLNNDFTNSNFEDYIHCQKNDLYGSPMTMTLPSTGQTVSYKVTQLTLNERLSETIGLRLAYDTLDRLRSREEVHLPWLELDSDQLFYLTYAQVHCTKSPLTSSYISLYEDEQLPSRIRIFVSASNNRLLGEAWKCPEGSGIIPSYTCSVFPYLHSSGTTVTMMRK